MRIYRKSALALALVLTLGNISTAMATDFKEVMVVDEYDQGKDKDIKLLDSNEYNLFQTNDESMLPAPVAEVKETKTQTKETMKLKDLPNGSVVIDTTWSWEHREGNGYTGVGDTKPIEWVVTAKNHMGYPNNSVTLIAKENISKYYFDNSINRGSEDGANHYGNSGTPNATAGIKPFLTTTLYNTFSSKFKDSILETTLNMRAQDGGSYVLKEKVFLPSVNEVGGVSTTSDGTNWGFFTDQESRVSNMKDTATGYWTRTPHAVNSSDVYYVTADGDIKFDSSASKGDLGVRPLVNIKADILVTSLGDRLYALDHIKDDTTPPSVDIILSNEKPTKEDVEITIVAKDVDEPNSIVSGVKRIQKPDGTWEDGSVVKYKVTSNGEYLFNVEDNAGNINEVTVKVINISKGKPVNPSIALSNYDPTNKDVTATITYSEDSSIKEYKTTSTEWRPYTGPIKVTSNTTITARGTNLVGVASDEVSYAISNIDKSRPNPPTLTPSTTTNTNRDINVIIQANGEYNRIEYMLEGGSWTIYTSPIIVSRNMIIAARVVSEAGNESNVAYLDVKNVNKSVPRIYIDDYEEEPTSQPVTITASVDEGTLNATSHTFKTNGSFTFKAKNDYGSTSERTVKVDWIDEDLPTDGTITIIGLDEDKNEIYSEEKKDQKLGKHTIKAPDIKGYTVKGSKSKTVELKSYSRGNDIEVKFDYEAEAKVKDARSAVKELERLTKDAENKRTIITKERAENKLEPTLKLIDKLDSGKIRDDLTEEYNKLKDRIAKITIKETANSIDTKSPSMTVSADKFVSRHKGNVPISNAPINRATNGVVTITLTNAEKSKLSNSLTPVIYKWDSATSKWIAMATKVNGNTLTTYKSAKGYVAVFGISQPKFADVKENDWFFRYIERANNLSLLEGSKDKDGILKANPNATISRAELYTMVSRLFGATTKGKSTLYNEFNYITEKSGKEWYQPYIQEYVNKKIISKMFTEKQASEEIKREEVVVLLTKMLELVEDIDYINMNDFTDTRGKNIKIANIIQGYEDGTLRLDNKITRAEALTLIINAIEELGW